MKLALICECIALFAFLGGIACGYETCPSWVVVIWVLIAVVKGLHCTALEDTVEWQEKHYTEVIERLMKDEDND